MDSGSNKSTQVPKIKEDGSLIKQETKSSVEQTDPQESFTPKLETKSSLEQKTNSSVEQTELEKVEIQSASEVEAGHSSEPEDEAGHRRNTVPKPENDSINPEG